MILVTGGTGLVGAHLLYFLVKAGKEVRAIHRTNSDLNRVKRVFDYFDPEAETLFQQIHWCPDDLNDLPALDGAFQGVTQVYHAAAYVNFNPKNYGKLKKSNVEGTAHVVDLCLAHGVEKLCYLSSVATLDKSVPTAEIDEEHHWNPNKTSSVYAYTKHRAEMEVWRGTQEGLAAVILNPGIILGSGFWQTGSGAFFPRVYKHLPYYPAGTTGFVDVVDVARIALQLMEESLINERYILVSENLSFREVFSQIADALDKKPPHIALNPWMLYTARQLDALRSRLSGKPQTLFKSTARAAMAERSFSNKKICETLAITFTPVEETIRRVAGDFLSEYSVPYP